MITPMDFMTPEQKAELDKKLGTETKGWPNEYAPLSIRNLTVATARISLGLKPFKTWKIASGSRFQIALHIGRAVLAEEIDDQEHPSPWREVVPFVKTHELGDAGLAMLKDWEAERDRQVTKFMDVMSPARRLGPALAALQQR